MDITAIIFIIIGYLIGSINSAILVCKFMNLPNPREQGSGNPGATNVLRTGNKGAAALVLVGDILKGVIAVCLARLFNVDHFALGLVAIAAVVGHMFPIFFGFKGGKGVATTLGVIIGLNLILAIAVAITWVVVAMFTRYSSLAAIVACCLGVIYSLFLSTPGLHIAILLLAIIVVARHYSNIMRLLDGKESKLFEKS